MSAIPLRSAALVLAGLLLGWLLWGKGPDISKTLAENAALRARVAARESTVAQLVRLAVQIDTARYRAVRSARLQRDTVRIEVARADSSTADAGAQLAQGDSAGAIASLRLANHYLAIAVHRCEAAAAELEVAATTTCDRARAADSTALAARAATIADQAERIDELEGDLKNARPRKPWAAGVVFSERLAPRGFSVSRDLGPLVLQGMAVREIVTDSGGRRRQESRGYLIGSLRF